MKAGDLVKFKGAGPSADVYLVVEIEEVPWPPLFGSGRRIFARVLGNGGYRWHSRQLMELINESG